MVVGDARLLQREQNRERTRVQKREVPQFALLVTYEKLHLITIKSTVFKDNTKINIQQPFLRLIFAITVLALKETVLRPNS